MSRQSPGRSVELSTSRRHDHVAMSSSELHDHMLRDHGRSGSETDGLPLADLHRFEHVEQEMGLIGLGHRHPADVGTGTRVSAEPGAAPLIDVLA